MKGSRPLALALVILAVIFAAAAVFYITQKTSFLADTKGIHWKHALAFGGLAVVSLVAANFARPRASSA